MKKRIFSQIPMLEKDNWQVNWPLQKDGGLSPLPPPGILCYPTPMHQLQRGYKNERNKQKFKPGFLALHLAKANESMFMLSDQPEHYS